MKMAFIELVGGLTMWEMMITSYRVTIPSEVGQGCRMCLLALSIMVRGAKNVNKRLFRSIEAVLSSYWLQLNGDIVASSLL